MENDSILQDKIIQLFSEIEKVIEKGNINEQEVRLVCYKLECLAVLNYRDDSHISIPSMFVDTLIRLLRLNNYDITKTALIAIAVLAKNDDLRYLMHDETFISALCERLKRVSNKKDVKDLVTCKLLCRALGNLCCYHVQNRKLVATYGGIEVIVEVIKGALTLGRSDLQSELLSYATGFMLNFLTHDESGSKICPVVEKEGILDILKTLLELEPQLRKDEGIYLHCLMLLGMIIDELDLNRPMLDDRLYAALSNLLKTTTFEESLGRIIDIMNTQTSHIEGAISLAKAGVGEGIARVIVQHKDKVDLTGDERAHIFRDVTELATSIICEVESMIFLYDNGNGAFYKSAVQWLTDPDYKVLRDTGLRFLGNFARQDDVCVQMGEEGIIKELLQLLNKQCNGVESLSIQCLVYTLTTLKNLLIPRENKLIATELGVPDALLSIATAFEMNGTIVFKIFGAMRMIVDGNAYVAKQFGTNEKLLKQIVDCGQMRDLYGVRDEAQRLISWITKNSRSDAVLLKMAEKSAALALSEMLNSKHSLMQLEALLAMFLISSKYLTRIENQIISCNVMEKLQKLLNEETLNNEVFANILTLTYQFSLSEKLKQEMKNFRICDLIRDRTQPGGFDVTRDQKLLIDALVHI